MKNKPETILVAYKIGLTTAILGSIIILAEFLFRMVYILLHTVYDVVPADEFVDEDYGLFLKLVPSIWIPFLLIYLISTAMVMRASNRQPWVAFSSITFFGATLGTNAMLIFGGGWYIGTITADFGLVTLLLSIALKVSKFSTLNHNKESRLQKKKILKINAFLSMSVVVAAMFLFLSPLITEINNIPAPLISAASSKPQGISPNHSNTFYILPIWEEAVTNDSYGLSKAQYLKDTVGGDAYTGTGFVKIGRSLSCWYTNDLLPDGSYNSSNLYKALNLSADANLPVLFHMNGGNWGQASSTHSNITAMRTNISNCQWDQNNWCPDIGYNPGPNDRFWSFWPGSEWEAFREFNIKKALAIIYDWWQMYPDLLVGFSTDSEYHLNNHYFEDENPGDYKSYFDYNPGTIQQFRDWAQANYSSLADFNQACGTSFASWPEVDAPRSNGIVGNKGNPWWETWTDFRIWHVKEASKRQCKWINESGFPRNMIWNHQILSKPGDDTARYQRCDPLETAINDYSKVGVTRYDWISPTIWHSLGELALNDGSGDVIPSWGIFEWNLWHQHEYWAYREMLNCIYQYGGHVICPNEWTNASRNEGLWIPGEDPNTVGDDSECNETNEECICIDDDCVKRHGNPQFQQALKDFVAKAQDYERGTAPTLRVNGMEIALFQIQDFAWEYFGRDPGIYVMAAGWFVCIIAFFVLLGVANRKQVEGKEKSTDLAR